MKKIDWPNQLFNFVGVIVGVFIAFYLNDAAQNSKAQKELSHIIEAILDDVGNDQTTFLEYQIPTNETQLKGIEKLIEGIYAQNEDSIAAYVQYAISVDNYHPASATYNSAKATGKLELIESLEIKAGLSDYYDVLAEEAKAKGKVQADYLLEQIMPWFTKNTDLIHGNFSKMKGNTEIANLLVLYSNFIENKTENYKDIARVSKDLEILLKNNYPPSE